MAKVKVVIESDELIKVSVTKKDDDRKAIEKLKEDIEKAEGDSDEN